MISNLSEATTGGLGGGGKKLKKKKSPKSTLLGDNTRGLLTTKQSPGQSLLQHRIPSPQRGRIGVYIYEREEGVIWWLHNGGRCRKGSNTKKHVHHATYKASSHVNNANNLQANHYVKRLADIFYHNYTSTNYSIPAKLQSSSLRESALLRKVFLVALSSTRPSSPRGNNDNCKK